MCNGGFALPINATKIEGMRNLEVDFFLADITMENRTILNSGVFGKRYVKSQ